MTNDSAVLSSIKTQVQQVLPDSRVMLFGSRAYSIPTEESDWDILILTPQPVTRSIKNAIHNALFPISAEICSFINALTVQEGKWLTNPSYYCLQQTISDKNVQLCVLKKKP